MKWTWDHSPALSPAGMEEPFFVFQLLKCTWKQCWKNIGGLDENAGWVPLWQLHSVDACVPVLVPFPGTFCFSKVDLLFVVYKKKEAMPTWVQTRTNQKIRTMTSHSQYTLWWKTFEQPSSAEPWLLLVWSYSTTCCLGAGSSPGACMGVVEERLELASTTGFGLTNMKGLTLTRTARKLPPVQTGTTRSSKLRLNCSGSNWSQSMGARAAAGCGGLQNTAGRKAWTCSSLIPPCCWTVWTQWQPVGSLVIPRHVGRHSFPKGTMKQADIEPKTLFLLLFWGGFK